MDREWFTDLELSKQFEIAQLENEDTHVTNLYGREINGEWEYVIVRWRYLSPYVVARFKGGKLLEDGLD